ncbi:superoxide dismutase [Cesiribacter sp. SM1]|uniref:superoxide dismutase n=1 Tax=Cesiribacter sp. SM1 TaxID=2861196 RepID=UPI001CD1AB97|nr:superoxide dismutase [Cesiribacter sp. SM1]
MAFELPNLPYPSNALEPNIDQQTMEIHHGRHHKGYTDNLNKAIQGTDMENKSIEEILKNVSGNNAVRNNGGGYYNHNLFWEVMSPNGGGQPTGAVAEAINKKWGSFDKFKEEFSNAAATRFGSGWAWLIVTPNGEVDVTSTQNQDNPLMDVAEKKGTPILGLDVWEHAYYLKYQNKRVDYVGNWWNVVNWEAVNRRFEQARKK